MSVKRRLKYIEDGITDGVMVGAMVQQEDIVSMERFKVFSRETADEDICEILYVNRDGTSATKVKLLEVFLD